MNLHAVWRGRMSWDLANVRILCSGNKSLSQDNLLFLESLIGTRILGLTGTEPSLCNIQRARPFGDQEKNPSLYDFYRCCQNMSHSEISPKNALSWIIFASLEPNRVDSSLLRARFKFDSAEFEPSMDRHVLISSILFAGKVWSWSIAKKKLSIFQKLS